MSCPGHFTRHIPIRKEDLTQIVRHDDEHVTAE